MSRDGLPLSLDAIAGFGDAIVREARHAQAIASLDGSPVPALLEAVHALQAALLSANPGALRARAGWIGRLLGRDLVLEAEGRVFRERLRVLVHDADAKLAAFARFDDGIAAHEQRLLASIEALGAAIAGLDGATPDVQLDAIPDAIERRRVHLLALQQAWRITASQLALTRLNHRQLAQRIRQDEYRRDPAVWRWHCGLLGLGFLETRCSDQQVQSDAGQGGDRDDLPVPAN